MSLGATQLQRLSCKECMKADVTKEDQQGFGSMTSILDWAGRASSIPSHGE